MTSAAGPSPGRRRAPHPITLLRWFRAGVLAMVAATALLYLVVSNQAGEQIAAAQRTREAIEEIDAARDQAGNAQQALGRASRTGEVELIGTGSDFANATARVGTLVTSAAEANAAGKRGLNHIQFVQGQLTTCVRLANGADGVTAASGALTGSRQKAADGRDVPFTGGLMASLTDLADLQREAVEEQLRSRWLNPALFWPLLIGPAAVMLVLVWASGHLVARHFRRYPSPALVLALLATAAVGITTGLLCGADRDGVSDPLSPDDGLVMAIALPLLAAAGALAYLAYRPRLAEYRFPHS